MALHAPNRSATRTRSPRSRTAKKNDELEGTTVFDVWPTDITLGPRPTTMRPQLELIEHGTTHVIEFTMPEDLAAGMLGKVVAGAWFTQLLELGAIPSNANS